MPYMVSLKRLLFHRRIFSSSATSLHTCCTIFHHQTQCDVWASFHRLSCFVIGAILAFMRQAARPGSACQHLARLIAAFHAAHLQRESLLLDARLAWRAQLPTLHKEEFVCVRMPVFALVAIFLFAVVCHADTFSHADTALSNTNSTGLPCTSRTTRLISRTSRCWR